MNTNTNAERSAKAAEILGMPARHVTLDEPMEQKTAENIVRSLPPVANENDGRTATIPVKTIGKIWRHRGYDVSRIFGDFIDLYKTALHGWSEPEILKDGHKAHPNVKEYHHYVNKFTDGDGEYYIRFTVVEENVKAGTADRNLIHSSAISDVGIYKKSDGSQRIRVRVPGEEKPPPSVDDHSQPIRDRDPEVVSPSPFIDQKLKEFLKTSV